MKIELIDIKDLKLDKKNARKHPQKNLDQIKYSLENYGQQKPIVIKDNVVVAGNGTLMAAKDLGWDKIACVRSELTGSNLAAYALVDNRSTETSEWDMVQLPETLKILFEEGINLEALGFSQSDLAEAIEEGKTDPDAIPENVETRCKPGDLWLLGEHRLLCGDSTNIQHVERLMNGEKADMVFTDPPYGVSYQSNMRTKSDKFDVIENDDKILTEWIHIIPIVSAGWVFIWTSWKVLATWLDVTSSVGKMTNLIVWDKGGGGIGDLTGTFSSDYEVALVFNRGATITGKRLGSVWSIGKDRATDYRHPTQKPVELAETAIQNVTNTKASILDLFLGSGSTLIACEKTGRKCYGMEIDPHYCDVILKRWEDFTGKTATYFELP